MLDNLATLLRAPRRVLLVAVIGAAIAPKRSILTQTGTT